MSHYINVVNTPQILQRNPNRDIYSLNKANYIAFMFLCIYNIVYFWSETLQSSDLIANSSHISNNAVNVAYDLFFINLICFALFKLSDIKIKYTYVNLKTIFIYAIFSTLGGLIFALLGEISFLKHFVVVKGILKHLDGKAIAVILFFTIFITISAIIEIIDSIKIKQFKKELKMVLMFASVYAGVLFFLISLKATSINYHVHHAIFAAGLSLLFTNWDRYLTIIWHAIFMGVVVEGINFYGVQELYLFLSSTGPTVSFYTILIISLGLTLVNCIGLYFNYQKYIKKLLE